MAPNKSVIFAKVPQGWPTAGENVTVETREIDLDAAPPSGGLTLKIYCCSFDPYMRGRMRPAEIKSYSPAFPLGDPIRTWSIAKVLKSDNADYKEGDIVRGMFEMSEYPTVPGSAIKALNVEKLSNPWSLDWAYFIGALGMPGLTAYSSFYEIGKPKKGETIFISAASGAVGQLVGQLAKHEGLRVIGSVGSDEKLEFIQKELGFDGGFNYKKEKPAAALKRLAPDGVDIYFENVGGEQLDAALAAMNNFGRIIACGMVSQYNNTPDQIYGVKNLMLVVAKRLTMRGFIVGDPGFGPVYAKDHHTTVGQWLSEGSFKAVQSFTDNIDDAPQGMIGMFKGENFGKAVLRIADISKEVRGKSNL